LRIAVSGEDDAVKGEGRVDRYGDRILVESFSFSMTSEETTVRKTSESASGKVKLGTVSITRPFDLASNQLSRLLIKRTKFVEARLTVDQQMTWGQGDDKEQNAIIVFHLLNGHVTDQKFNAREADKGASISETVELSFKNVEIEYYILSRNYRDGALRNFREKFAVPFATSFDEHDD
jgi:type VI protein secretion system component Hcp